jgi:hypothetical protein
MLRDEHTPPTNTARAIQKWSVSPPDGRTIGETHHGSQLNKTMLKLDSYRLLRSPEGHRRYGASRSQSSHPLLAIAGAGVGIGEGMGGNTTW